MVIFSSLQAAHKAGFQWFAREGEFEVVFMDGVHPRTRQRQRSLAFAYPDGTGPEDVDSPARPATGTWYQ